jgi:prepilin-type N-terminal cleavage/methylation domain-containing protein
MRISIRGTRSNRGFTLVELAVVLFVLGLVLWIAIPRLSRIGDPGRDAVFRDLSAESEAAYDLSLFEKREARLVLDPAAGTYDFRVPGRTGDTARPREFGSKLTVTGIRVEGEDRPLDIPTEIRYLPGGRVPTVWIYFQDGNDEAHPTRWTLRLNPFNGSMKVTEGTVTDNG